ncbi:MAG: metallopeptidase [Candidatus Aenigmarchaeota archaeon]|nr:metallopeptidase [Candidatus Aenigmarchaeota archaeon]
MGITYHPASDINELANVIVEKLDFDHIDMSRVIFLRSAGSKSQYTLARCHTLPRVMQKALGMRPHYVIEVVSEKFDRLEEEEKIKTIIHELMHIPKSFRGGFRHHADYVTRRQVEMMYRDFTERL